MARGARFSKMVSWLLSEVDQIAHSLTSRIYSIRPVSSQVETSIDGRLISITKAEIDERTVDVHVGRLRKALTRGRERDPIRTVRGAGYSFDETFGKS